MAQGIKLTDSISVSELMHMREVEGLSNAQIAKKLDCHISTVYHLIGKQPAEITRRNQMAGMRKVKELPPLTESKTEIPDMPRESFKERCERLMVKTDENIATVNKLRDEIAQKASASPVVEATSEADKAREAHCKAPGKAAAEDFNINSALHRLGDIALEAHCLNEQAKKNSGIISELLAVFGPDIVRDYLRVSLYAMGIPYCRELKRDHLLTALKLLNKEEIRID